jgi:hypothetical protein
MGTPVLQAWLPGSRVPSIHDTLVPFKSGGIRKESPGKWNTWPTGQSLASMLDSKLCCAHLRAVATCQNPTFLCIHLLGLEIQESGR